jgi:microtubule-associated protein-like 6
VSPNGKFLAVGAMSGRVSIFDPNSLKKIQEINEVIDPDKETLSEVKFSPNSEILAVAYCPPVSTIVFYSSKNWKRINEIKDIPARVMMMDFSVDGKYIQTSLGNNDIMFFTVASASVLQSGESILKEEKWATFTNIFGWAT